VTPRGPQTGQPIAAGPARSESVRPTPASPPPTQARAGLSGLWLLLVPMVCCGGPLLIGALAAAGALAWGGLGLGLVVIAAAVVLVQRRRRRPCCEPEAGSGWPSRPADQPRSPR
jgi:hypothetical protein